MSNYINGVSLPGEEERNTVGSSRATGRNIAAIDFGTTHCSLAYCMAGSQSISLLPLDTNGNCRIPSSILIDDDHKIKAFGHRARHAYSALSAEKKKTHYYFKEMKMELQHGEVCNVSGCIANTRMIFYSSLCPLTQSACVVRRQ